MSAEEVELGPRERPVHLDLGNIGLVAAGGALGTGLRHGISLLLPAACGTPSAIWLINIVGAFLLGLVLESLLRVGPDEASRRRIRLGVGTGLLGGFTTYSTLAVDTVLLTGAHPGLGIAYGLTTVLVGGAASFAGIALARRGGRADVATPR